MRKLQLTGFSFLFLILFSPHQDLMLLCEMIPLLLSEPLSDHGRQKEATMSRNLSRYALIFLLLALSGLFFLLRNIHSVEVRDQSRFLLKNQHRPDHWPCLFFSLCHLRAGTATPCQPSTSSRAESSRPSFLGICPNIITTRPSAASWA